MSEERKPVVCRYCGSEMRGGADGDESEQGTNYFYVCHNCMAISPANHDKESAYFAATRTPPNLPLTLPELFGLADDDAAWVVLENGRIWAMGAECAQEWASEENCLFFAAKPTPDDIAAAREAKK